MKFGNAIAGSFAISSCTGGIGAYSTVAVFRGTGHFPDIMFRANRSVDSPRSLAVMRWADEARGRRLVAPPNRCE